jgi:hypothetical protein
VSPRDGGERWAGMVRRMHAEPGGGLHADIAVLGRSPQALSLREVLEQYADSIFTNASSRQFVQSSVHAVILSDGAEPSQPPNLLLPPEAWKDGRIFESQEGDAVRYLRCVKVVRRGGDFVRATFEWLTAPEQLPQL